MTATWEMPLTGPDLAVRRPSGNLRREEQREFQTLLPGMDDRETRAEMPAVWAVEGTGKARG